MTLKVVHGIIRERPLSNEGHASHTHTVQRAVQGVRTAQTTGSVAGNEATLTTLRSSRGAASTEKIRDPDVAQRKAHEVAEKIVHERDTAADSHNSMMSVAAKDRLF